MDDPAELARQYGVPQFGIPHPATPCLRPSPLGTAPPQGIHEATGTLTVTVTGRAGSLDPDQAIHMAAQGLRQGSHVVGQGHSEASRSPAFAGQDGAEGTHLGTLSVSTPGDVSTPGSGEAGPNPSGLEWSGGKVSGQGINQAHMPVCRPAVADVACRPAAADVARPSAAADMACRLAAADVACRQVLQQLTQVHHRSSAVAGRDADADQGEVAPPPLLPASMLTVVISMRSILISPRRLVS